MVNTRAATKRAKLTDDASVAAPIQTQKRKTEDEGPSTKKQKRRRGKPSGELCQLNLDVLHLIAEYIHPRDLLTLARTCKSLRDLLMDKSSKFVWKAARGQVSGLPDCPDDLTEPEYANLVFHARCHGCGKYAKKIYWRIRRRYCPECRATRLRPYFSCDAILRLNCVLGENATINNEKGRWVDREQLDSAMQEYDRSYNKTQFLDERRKKLNTISCHASDCESWEDNVTSDRKSDLKLLRRERQDDIFERLEQQGYGPEIAHHGRGPVYICHKSFFKPPKPLTDKDWARMLPAWTESMKSLTAQRMEGLVYKPRRQLLEPAYIDYIRHPSPNTPVFDLLPTLEDLMEFSLFRDIICAPEGTELGQKPFESAFEGLPGLVDEWRKQLDIKLAGLVKIPSNDQSSAENMDSSQVPTDKFRLACAVFEANPFIAHYPDILYVMHSKDVSFWKPAICIVQACGLDPHVATIEDMDRRNARFKCLCDGRLLRTWRNMLRHARCCPRFSDSLGVVDDEQIDAIQAIEQKDDRPPPLSMIRCLLCRPRVGSAMFETDKRSHFAKHGIDIEKVQCDVHFMPVGMQLRYCSVRMAEDGTLEGHKSFNFGPAMV